MRISKKEWNKLKKKEKLLKEAASILRVEEKDLPRVVERFQREIKEMDKYLS
jgi:alanyl-tRNA synthetase